MNIIALVCIISLSRLWCLASYEDDRTTGPRGPFVSKVSESLFKVWTCKISGIPALQCVAKPQVFAHSLKYGDEIIWKAKGEGVCKSAIIYFDQGLSTIAALVYKDKGREYNVHLYRDGCVWVQGYDIYKERMDRMIETVKKRTQDNFYPEDSTTMDICGISDPRFDIIDVNIEGIPSRIFMVNPWETITRIIDGEYGVWKTELREVKCLYCIQYFKNAEPKFTIVVLHVPDGIFQVFLEYQEHEGWRSNSLRGWYEIESIDHTKIATLKLNTGTPTKFILDVLSDEGNEKFELIQAKGYEILTRVYVVKPGYSMESIIYGSNKWNIDEGSTCFMCELHSRDEYALLRIHVRRNAVIGFLAFERIGYNWRSMNLAEYNLRFWEMYKKAVNHIAKQTQRSGLVLNICDNSLTNIIVNEQKVNKLTRRRFTPNNGLYIYLVKDTKADIWKASANEKCKLVTLFYTSKNALLSLDIDNNGRLEPKYFEKGADMLWNVISEKDFNGKLEKMKKGTPQRVPQQSTENVSPKASPPSRMNHVAYGRTYKLGITRDPPTRLPKEPTDDVRGALIRRSPEANKVDVTRYDEMGLTRSPSGPIVVDISNLNSPDYAHYDYVYDDNRIRLFLPKDKSIGRLVDGQEKLWNAKNGDIFEYCKVYLKKDGNPNLVLITKSGYSGIGQHRYSRTRTFGWRECTDFTSELDNLKIFVEKRGDFVINLNEDRDTFHCTIFEVEIFGLYTRFFFPKLGYHAKEVTHYGVSIWRSSRDDERCLSCDLYPIVNGDYLLLVTIMGIYGKESKHYEKLGGHWALIAEANFYGRISSMSGPTGRSPTNTLTPYYEPLEGTEYAHITEPLDNTVDETREISCERSVDSPREVTTWNEDVETLKGRLDDGGKDENYYEEKVLAMEDRYGFGDHDEDEYDEQVMTSSYPSPTTKESKQVPSVVPKAKTTPRNRSTGQDNSHYGAKSCVPKEHAYNAPYSSVDFDVESEEEDDDSEGEESKVSTKGPPNAPLRNSDLGVNVSKEKRKDGKHDDPGGEEKGMRTFKKGRVRGINKVEDPECDHKMENYDSDSSGMDEIINWSRLEGRPIDTPDSGYVYIPNMNVPGVNMNGSKRSREYANGMERVTSTMYFPIFQSDSVINISKYNPTFYNIYDYYFDDVITRLIVPENGVKITRLVYCGHLVWLGSEGESLVYATIHLEGAYPILAHIVKNTPSKDKSESLFKTPGKWRHISNYESVLKKLHKPLVTTFNFVMDINRPDYSKCKVFDTTLDGLNTHFLIPRLGLHADKVYHDGALVWKPDSKSRKTGDKWRVILVKAYPRDDHTFLIELILKNQNDIHQSIYYIHFNGRWSTIDENEYEKVKHTLRIRG